MRLFLSRLLWASLLAVLLQAQSVPPDSEVYQVVFLRPAADRKAIPKAEMDRILSAHMANIHSMADRMILVAAGPFGDTPPTISGVFVMKAASFEEALHIAEQDPTVVEHRNTADGFTWHGPKGIGAEYTRLHREHPETPENMGAQPFFLLYSAPSRMAPNQLASSLRAHADYVQRLRREGKLAAAGPAEGKDGLVELVVLHRMPDEEARGLMEGDPGVKAGLIRTEYHHWWCADHVLPW